jgi:hypothetical protein
MMTAARRLGEMPTLAERIAALERIVREQAAQLAAQAAMIAMLVADRDVAAAIDGEVPTALSSSWRPIKAAAADVGFSVSGLRAAIRRHEDGPRWWRFRAGRLLVNIDTCPRKRKRT